VQAAAAGTRFKNCTFTHSNGASLTAVGIKVEGTALIDDCEFSNIATPIQVTGTTPGVKIRRNTFSDWSMRAIYILGTSSGSASNIRIIGNDFGPPNAAAGSSQPRQPIAFQGDDTKLFTNVRVSKNNLTGTGTSHDPTSGQLSGGAQYGTADLISLHQVDGFVVSDNIVTDGGDVGITIAQQCKNGTVTGNTCLRNDSAGICIGSSSSTYTRNITVTGNTCVNNGQNRAADGPDWASNGINVQQASGVTISGNRCGDDQGTKTQQYGVAIQNSSEVTVGVNDLTGNGIGETYQASNTGLSFATTPKIATLGSDVTVTNTTTLAASGLSIPVDGNAVYRMEAWLLYNAATAADMGVKFNGPTGATLAWTPRGLGTGTSSGSGVAALTSAVIGTTANIGGAGANAVATPAGLLTTGSTAGSLTLSFAQATADASDAILRAGSWVMLTRIA
jgi:hypothetical protein